MENLETMVDNEVPMYSEVVEVVEEPAINLLQVAATEAFEVPAEIIEALDRLWK